MTLYLLSLLLLFSLMQLPTNAQESNSDLVSEARAFFLRENELLRQNYNKLFLASYTYSANITEENQLAVSNASTIIAMKNKDLAHRIKDADYIRIRDDEAISRQVRLLSDLGFDVLNETDLLVLKNAISAMETNYATATVCSYTNVSDCTLTLEPHILERFKNSRDSKELAHYWRQWHDKAGTPSRSNFAKYVQLSRKASNLNNYDSYADYWLHLYEDPDFENNVDTVYKAILPLYREIHGYVRYRLREHYNDSVISAEGNIPMHLLGSMWGHKWDTAIELYTPFRNKSFIDVTAEMKRQQYTVQKLFELGDQFFRSLNMRPLPDSFWNLSMLERPVDRPIICHASSWDLLSHSDVRITMCTEIDMNNLHVVHHELGHIQYFLQYEQHPAAFRSAPNLGFHEAIGDLISLSVLSPKHLQLIELSPAGKLDEESRINELFKTALQKIVLLPFAYHLDKYRYAVFRNEIDEPTWNCGFWKMLSELTGVEPPVPRSDIDFDPPSTYHVSSNVEYLRYFAADIFQFQFHKAMCTMAGQYESGNDTLTLDNCDIYNSKTAGAALSKFLTLGSSKHWKEALKDFTGETEMNPDAILEYFAPLTKWLKAENKRLGVPIGWEATDKIAPKEQSTV